MKKLRYSVTINAPVQDVWTTMLSDATYREWASVFSSGSYYEGDWNQGSEIRFLGPDGDGSLGGMIATVEENRPNELISLRYVGQIVNGEEDTTSEEAKAFMGAHEKYAFSAAGGVTTVDVELDSEDEFVAMFDEAWPLALEKLKDIVEARS
ncbi:MAG: SRPBCC domain-containing protein [Arthrobacter sp.]|nr:SRPBCC domain-containing protein [Arthrobacter sp.]MDZ4353917.1 SRPBCC domain-containing protein [Arthrobacter sp.]